MWSDRRWVRVVLAVSVLANIFLIGVVTGHLFAGTPGRPIRPRPVVANWVRSSTLPQADKRGFAAAMAPYHESIETKRSALKQARAALDTAIVAPVYDRAKVSAAFADVRHASVESQEVTQTALVEALATLSPSARASLLPNR